MKIIQADISMEETVDVVDDIMLSQNSLVI